MPSNEILVDYETKLLFQGRIQKPNYLTKVSFVVQVRMDALDVKL